MATLSAIQMHSVPDVDANLAFIDAQLSQLPVAEEHLVVLPECCLFFGGSDQQQLALAEPLNGDGPMQRGLQQLAARYGVYLLAGSIPTQVGDTKFHASSVLIDKHGKHIADYQKLHLFDVDVDDNAKNYRESTYTQAGNTLTTQSLVDINVGLSICYDVRFASLYQQLVRAGANVITVPAAFTQVTGAAHWQPLLQARAIESQCYIIAAGQVGEHENGRQTYGHSMIIDPWGEICCQLTDQVGSISTTFDASLVQRVRQNIPVIEHNRFNCSLQNNEPDLMDLK